MTNEADLTRKIELLESRLYDLEQMELTSVGEKVSNLGIVRSYVLSLMGLRGFWPFGAIHKHGTVDSGFTVPDASGSGLSLYAPIGGEPTVFHWDGSGFLTYFDFNGTTDYLYSPSHINHHLSGTEGWIETANRGLTIGCWIHPDVALGSGLSYGIISKFNTAGDERAYYLLATETSGPDLLRCLVYQSSGTSNNFLSSLEMTVSQWNFVVMRWDPSTEIKLWLNGDSEILTSSIVSSVQEVIAPLTFAARSDQEDFLNGKMAMPFVIGAALEDDIITSIYNISRAVIGV